EVAIKKMLKPFQSDIHAKRTYRELKLLIHLNHEDASVVQLFNVFSSDESLDKFKTLYFVLNYVTYDLNKLIKRKQPFSELQIQTLVYAMLRGVKFIHSSGVIHRDLKPSNIGVDPDLNLSILDFGLARVVTPVDGILTGYVATRWWRAPEIICNWESYTSKSDVWSIGCIMAELVMLKPIFPGRDQSDQLTKILEIVGTPTENKLDEICEIHARTFIKNNIGRKSKRDFQEYFGNRGLSRE
ncbi:unnamed protein product, partial [Didymodactylos carnosus]